MLENTIENKEKWEKYLADRTFTDIDIVDLIQFIASHFGASTPNTYAKEKLEQIIEPTKKIVLVLVDGMGAYKVSDLPEQSLFRKNLKYAIKTVNPTSTACVLSSIASASYPSKHGIFGWWQYSKRHQLNYYPLLFMGRKTGISLKEKKISPKEIFPFNSIFDEFHTSVSIYQNREYVNSVFSKKFAGKNAKSYGTYSIRDAFKRVNEALKKQEEGFHYVYIDGLDLKSHMYGINSKEANDTIYEVEENVEKIARENENTTVIVIADHGQVMMTNMLYLNQKTDYTKYFYAMPSIDTRMISFFVKEECKQEFVDTFLQEFGKDVILLTKEEAKASCLFGGYEFSEAAENAIGEYIAIIVHDKFMVCDKVAMEDKLATKGNHSGITKYETTIPLIVVH